MTQESTHDRILNAAEALFAEQGLHVTTLRQITQSAGVNLAAVNYHFGSKQALLLAVFRRRLDALNSARIERLDQALRRVPGPQLEDVLDALVYPALAFSRGSESDGHRFMQLLMRAFADRDEALRAAISQEYAFVMRRFAEAIQQCLPHLESRQLRNYLDFIVGALTYAMAESRLADPRAIASDLVRFAAGGLRAGLSHGSMATGEPRSQSAARQPKASTKPPIEDRGALRAANPTLETSR
ncbi:MAG: TetR/AcrR family transcriptional regulator [Wenzhouxiangella sp.]